MLMCVRGQLEMKCLHFGRVINGVQLTTYTTSTHRYSRLAIFAFGRVIGGADQVDAGDLSNYNVSICR